MRYRALDAEGDYQFGNRAAAFHIDTPDAVAQAVQTRLMLATGDWFLDLLEGTPYSTHILGHGTLDVYDQVIRERISGTIGVRELLSYVSVLDGQRHLRVSCTIDTVYGKAQIESVF